MDGDSCCRRPGSIPESMKPAMFRWIVRVVVLSIAVGLISAAAMMATLSSSAAQEPERRDAFQRQVRPLLERYCVDCHMNGDAEAGIVLDRFEDQAAAVKGRHGPGSASGTRSQGRIMPPADMPQPSLEERDRIVGWIENDFLAAQCGRAGRLGAGRDPSAEPAGVRQHDPRPARTRPPPRGCLPAGRHRLRLRQRRLGAQHLARARREVSRRRRAAPCRRRSSCPTPRATLPPS